MYKYSVEYNKQFSDSIQMKGRWRNENKPEK